MGEAQEVHIQLNEELESLNSLSFSAVGEAPMAGGKSAYSESLNSLSFSAVGEAMLPDSGSGVSDQDS